MESSRTAALFHADAAGPEVDSAHGSHASNSLSNFLRVQGYKYSGSLASLHSSGGSHEVGKLFLLINGSVCVALCGS